MDKRPEAKIELLYISFLLSKRTLGGGPRMTMTWEHTISVHVALP